jgi:hypothetical protein
MHNWEEKLLQNIFATKQKGEKVRMENPIKLFTLYHSKNVERY